MGPLSSRNAETGMTPSVFWPISKNTFSSLTATTVASRTCSPAASRVWVCSNWLRMSPKELSAPDGFCLSCSRVSSSRSDEIGLDIGLITFLIVAHAFEVPPAESDRTVVKTKAAHFVLYSRKALYPGGDRHLRRRERYPRCYWCRWF